VYECVYGSVGLYVCEHNSITTHPNFTKFYVNVAYGCGSLLLFLCYVKRTLM